MMTARHPHSITARPFAAPLAAKDRFPEDFVFRLTAAEKAEVITNCEHLRPLRFSPSLPHAFAEHGAIMLASLLNTPIAVEGSVQIVRAFVRLREILTTHKELARKLEELGRRYDAQFKVVFDAIRQLMTPPERARRSIGFKVEESRPAYRCRKRNSKSTRETTSPQLTLRSGGPCALCAKRPAPCAMLRAPSLDLS